ncbi:glycosyltransferase family 8 protein [Hymenobacter sp. BT507]|uniref:Glycosyltransferase family 8 protein n=1 Tax=Hymenobacter citatus TaxID=2763506 RepID=A0ABR7MKS7_9BACT|nr:glycosyltransferase family 8 protein [Hymenobacter citatus]MBC6611655.1 glycosyltransferase family 8 protein [Hymenobacter citatus]
MHIAISFDQNFITPTYVFLTSVFNNNQHEKIFFHAIATGVSDKDKQDIEDYIQQHGAEIEYYNIDDKNLTNLIIPEHSYFTVATYYRLFFPSLVPAHVEQLLYIDTDTVVVGNLKDLYLTDVRPYPAGAVLDTVVAVRPDLGIDELGYYFNAGVLLINIPIWKEQKISEKSIQFLVDYPEKIKWVDQDALNAVLYRNVYKLAGGYNVTFYDIPKDLPRKKYKEFISDKYIIHYTTGLHKPWSILGENKFRYVYHDYLKKSPKSKERKYKNYKVDIKSASFFVKVRILEYLYDYPMIIKLLKRR